MLTNCRCSEVQIFKSAIFVYITSRTNPRRTTIESSTSTWKWRLGKVRPEIRLFDTENYWTNFLPVINDEVQYWFPLKTLRSQNKITVEMMQERTQISFTKATNTKIMINQDGITMAPAPRPSVLRTSKPKRCLNVYNIFFATEREKLLRELPARNQERPRWVAM